MSVRASSEELFLSNELMSPVKKQKLEQENTFDSFKALFFWAASFEESSREAYFDQMTDLVKMIPFKGARHAWIQLLQAL